MEVHNWVCSRLPTKSSATCYPKSPAAVNYDHPFHVDICSRYLRLELWQCREGLLPMPDQHPGMLCRNQFVPQLWLFPWRLLKLNWKPFFLSICRLITVCIIIMFRPKLLIYPEFNSYIYNTVIMRTGMCTERYMSALLRWMFREGRLK